MKTEYCFHSRKPPSADFYSHEYPEVRYVPKVETELSLSELLIIMNEFLHDRFFLSTCKN